ncbi:MAG: tetratricopeptide repeat protein [Spartobacteria bacterium]|nr:tetratricopeptide repeat protein [Spartobacteria bacterium]
MKHIAICLLLFLTVTAASSWAQAKKAAMINVHPGPEVLFQEAGTCYDQGDLTRAASLYNELANQNYNQFSVFFNLGNTCFRMGEYGEAILNFKRALALQPRDHDTLANLRFALESAGSVVPQPNIITRLLQILTFNEWIAAASVLWISLALFTIIYIMKPDLQPALLRILAINAVLLAIAIAACANGFMLQHQKEAVIIAKSPTAHSAPLSDSTTLFKLPEGSVVRIIGTSGEWINIDASGQHAWINKKDCSAVALQ